MNTIQVNKSTSKVVKASSLLPGTLVEYAGGGGMDGTIYLVPAHYMQSSGFYAINPLTGGYQAGDFDCIPLPKSSTVTLTVER